MSFRNNILAINKTENKFSLLFLFAVPVIIYFYFLEWKTDVIYGDDLYLFKEYSGLNSFPDKINMPVSFGKYRPMHGLSMQLIIEWFQKNLTGYYIFNVTVQAINSIIFAMIANLFLRSLYLSLFFGLLVGLSRFSLFNITQLLNGGALEGLAITFFLLSLFFIIRTLKNNDLSVIQKQKGILWSILFANLSLYTHERYIVILPFIILVILLSPSLKILSSRQKFGLSVVSVATIIINILVKKYIYGMPFFVGTAGTNIDFSVSTFVSFFMNALLSIFQINTGPEYLVGLQFSSFSIANKILVLLLFGSFIVILILYLTRVRKFFVSKLKDGVSDFSIFSFLLILFGLFLIPAVVTIRLEQRWLQASFCVFILVAVIALNSLSFKNRSLKNTVLVSFVFLFLWTDFNYLNKGVDNLYMSDSERLVKKFKHAIGRGTIRPGTSKLYVWRKQRDANSESAIQWSLGHGYLFEFYQNRGKQLIFVDSVSSFIQFDKNAEQIIFIGNDIVDITGNYLQDSLKSFNADEINRQSFEKKAQYGQKQLLITNDDFDKFNNMGFYQNENGIRWTNGNASIGFIGDFITKDTLNIELQTYLPPICANIRPEIVITDQYNTNYPALFTNRERDKFIYTIHFDKSIRIQKISILSDTIVNASPDVRRLSFPFISLELKK